MTTGASAITSDDVPVPRRPRSAAAHPPRQEEEQPGAVGVGGVHCSDASSPPPPRNVGPPAPSSSRGADAEADLRRRKGKMPVVVDVSANATGGANKLMGDAIRCLDASNKQPSVRSETRKRKQDHHHHHPFWFGTGSDGQSTSSAGSDLAVSMSTLAVVSNHLRAMLRDLGVAPTRVYGKMMSRSDRVTQQCRLLMSCKSWRAADHGPFPLDAFLTAAEKAAAARGAGLEVLALDRAGRVYEGMKCKYLESNSGYRVIGKWGDFLRHNGLVARGNSGNRANDVMIDLWMFRSPAGGRLGIVFVHYRKGDAAHADAAFEEEVVRLPRKVRRPGGAAAEDDDHDDGGGANDIVMGGAAYDAAVIQIEGEAATLPAPTAVEEDIASEKVTAVITLALDHGAKEDDQVGAQRKAISPSSSFKADAAKGEEEGMSAPLSSDGEEAEEETDARSKALQLLLLNCKQDVLQAAETLIEISRGVW